MQKFLSLTFTSTYRKKPLVVEVPFSHGARKFALRVERVFFCSLGWHGHENKKSVKISVNPMNRSRVKWVIRIFLLFFSSDVPLFLFLAKSCVLLGPADGREWAIKKLVAVLAAAAEQDAAAVRTQTKL